MNITKNKDKDTIYQVNKTDSLVTFEGHNYNIDDHITAKRLICMLIDKCIDSDNLIDDYKTLLKKETEAYNSKNKQFKNCLKDIDKLSTWLVYHIKD